MTYKTKVELGVAAVISAIAAFFIWQASFIRPAPMDPIGPQIFPMFLAISLMVGSGLLVWDAFRDPDRPLGDGYGFKESNIGRIFLVLGTGVIFLCTFWAAGYFTATFISVMLIMFAFGYRNVLTIAAIGLIVAVIYQAVFMGAMNLFDPPGQLIDIRPYTNWISGAS